LHRRGTCINQGTTLLQLCITTPSRSLSREQGYIWREWSWYPSLWIFSYTQFRCAIKFWLARHLRKTVLIHCNQSGSLSRRCTGQPI